MKKICSLGTMFAFIIFMSWNATAQPPQKFNYQGVARATDGSALENQDIALRISILNGSATGPSVYTETHQVTTNNFGLYTLAIGGGTVVSGDISTIDWGTGDKYVKVEIDPAGGSNYVNLGTAQLLSVPYALYAGNGGGGAVNGTTDKVAKFTNSSTLGNSQILDNGIGVGIGTVSPKATLQISGSHDLSLTIAGLDFEHQVLVAQTGSTATTEASNAIIGYADNSSLENHGLFGLANGSGNANNIGGFFSGASNNAGTNALSAGVYGVASSDGGNGVNNVGIYGAIPSAISGYAGFFDGDLAVTGYIYKAGGTFKIDHPLDPANKYLYHSFVESPDMMNVYNGNAVTDANGEVTVTLPDYFEALNKDFRYQLTVVDEHQFAMARIAKKINNNQFTIVTDKPNIEVSWQVTGIRHDKYAEAHPIQVEAEKEPENKGYYLHPKVWGQPETKGISYRMTPEAAKKIIYKEK